MHYDVNMMPTLTPPITDKDENQTRTEINAKLLSTGWIIQDHKWINLIAGEYGINGVAAREHPADTTPAKNYMPFISGKLCGIIKAKREGRCWSKNA